MTKKMKVNISGMQFELPTTCLQTDYDGKTIIRLGAKDAASIMKQYVKKSYPGLEIWVSSSKYAGGSSADIWICNPDGSSVPNEIYKKIDSFSNTLTAGSFNGMEDIYEYKRDGVTDNGITIVNYTKYVFVNNRPKNGSPLSIMLSLKGMMAGEYDFGVVDLETAVAKMKRFGYKESEINKGLQIMSI